VRNTQSDAKDAAYRRICIYTKSVERYKLQRERRRQVHLLSEKGFTQRQIADKLGISVRTVNRDWSKLQPFLKGQVLQEIRDDAVKQRREFEERYMKLTLKQQLKLLKRDVENECKKRRDLEAIYRRLKRRK
jgi:transcriptional antiterminator